MPRKPCFDLDLFMPVDDSARWSIRAYSPIRQFAMRAILRRDATDCADKDVRPYIAIGRQIGPDGNALHTNSLSVVIDFLPQKQLSWDSPSPQYAGGSTVFRFEGCGEMRAVGEACFKGNGCDRHRARFHEKACIAQAHLDDEFLR